MGAGNIDNGYARIMLADLFTLVSFGSGGDSSNVKCVVVRFDIRRGVATARQLAMETKGAIIIGKGTINLGTEQLDLHLSPYATAANLTNFAIPDHDPRQHEQSPGRAGCGRDGDEAPSLCR